MEVLVTFLRGTSEQREANRWWRTGLPLVLVGIVGVTYIATMLTSAAGRPIAPLDDAYITFQYARQIARGHPYQYNDGDPATTGMTSLLYGFLLAGAYLLGCTDERLVALAVGMGVIWLGLTALLTFRLTVRLVDDPDSAWPAWAALLVSLAGAVHWHSFNGMETGLFTVLTMAALDAFLARRTGKSALWLGLAGLVRPEGVILAVLTWMVALVEGLWHTRTVRWGEQAVLSGAVLVGLLPSLVNWVLTGSALAMGLQAKSWWLNIPFSWGPVVRSVLLSYRRIILGLFLGWRSPTPWFVTPGLLALAVLGWIGLGICRRWAALVLTGTWFLVGALSTATLITATWHMGRYQAPFVPLLTAVAISGLAWLYRGTALRWNQVISGLALIYLLASSAYSVPRFVRLYRAALSTIARQQLVLADWLRENLPYGPRVGVHDVGTIRYVGNRPTYDLIGLTTAKAAVAWRHGAGSVFELMEHSPMRPDYFAIYPNVFSIPYLAATDLFAEELFRVEVPDYAVASAGPIQGVWHADWRLADSGVSFYQPDILARTSGLRQMDALDVADLDDEASHQVEWWQAVSRPGFPTEVWQMKYRVLTEREVLDGGRLLTGGIAFDITTEPGRLLWIVARLHAQEAGAVRVEVDGRDVGRWAYPAVPGWWLETLFRIPADAVTRDRTHIALWVDAHNPDFRHYAPYFFWFLQGEPDIVPVTVEHRVDAVFNGQARLVGFNLPQQNWKAGDVISVTLYWQADELMDSDAKVFLHIYDEAGNLGPQSDGWAYYDTRPPYTWWPGEVIADPRQIALTETLPPGRYSLEVGLYNPDGSGRLQAYLDGRRQPEDRVVLSQLTID